MSDERLDRLIDDVAKQLTAGQPSSDFRARVIARLDPQPRFAWRPLWIVAPLGTLAVAVLVVLVARPFQGRDRGAESPAPRQSSQAAKTETAPAAPTPDGTTVRLPPSPPRGFHGTGRPDTRSNLSSGEAAVAALAPPPLEPPSIGVQALGVDRLHTESIAITELDAITPIAVAPLTTDDERPASGQRPSPNDRNE
jgi:hypothetical protein